MEHIEQEELYQIKGGTSISATFINSFTSMIKALFGIGQNLGASLRRIYEDSMCPLK